MQIWYFIKIIILKSQGYIRWNILGERESDDKKAFSILMWLKDKKKVILVR